MTQELFLFNDTETTGFAKKGELRQEGQARVCQVALMLTDSNGKPLAQFCSLIKPDGWKIGEGAQKVHGHTDEMCEKFGLNQKAVISVYQRLAAMANVIVAHNAEFDSNMMAIEEAYAETKQASVVRPWFCTMKTNTHITPGGKWPKLEEALKWYCMRSLGDKAHDAMNDLMACRDIFFAMREQKAKAANQ